MDCFKRIGIVTVLGLGLLAGCGKSSSTDGAVAEGAGPAITETDPANNPMAKAAYDFLDAVLKGDTQRASARLTPQAIQRIVASGKQFSPPGLESATFKIGAVRAPPQTRPSCSVCSPIVRRARPTAKKCAACSARWRTIGVYLASRMVRRQTSRGR